MSLILGEKIDMFAIGCREFDPSETIKTLRHFGGWSGVGSWGMRDVSAIKGKDKRIRAMRMTVSGRLFSGHVYITLNFSDLYDVVYCSNRGTIKKVTTDIYFDDLFQFMDNVIETP